MAKKAQIPKGKAVLLYDGHCLMCSKGVQWVMEKDRAGQIRFAALQDESIQTLIKEAPSRVQSADSVILYEGGQFYIYSTAVFRVLEQLGGIYRAVKILYLVPRPLRDAVYRWIAGRRKDWFGRSEQCFIVPPDQRYRFLTDPERDYEGSES
jgi:predicted DCC family thiol-disulfide oxidoreductase YuxK